MPFIYTDPRKRGRGGAPLFKLLHACLVKHFLMLTDTKKLISKPRCFGIPTSKTEIQDINVICHKELINNQFIEYPDTGRPNMQRVLRVMEELCFKTTIN